MCNIWEDKCNISFECFGILSFLEVQNRSCISKSFCRGAHSYSSPFAKYVDTALQKEATSKPFAGLIANKGMSEVARWTQQ